jgi:hypothetical protein
MTKKIPADYPGHCRKINKVINFERKACYKWRPFDRICSPWVHTMNEPPKDPNLSEVFERIAALEGEHGRLSNRVASLEARADSSSDYFVRLAKQVGRLIEQIGTMDLQVIELAEKVFPGYLRTQRQIMEFCNPPRKDDTEKKPRG